MFLSRMLETLRKYHAKTTITLNEDNSQVTGLLSKEGEEVGSSFIMTCNKF